MLWLDAFTANVDRTWRNPNLLVWNGVLHVIDHGASLYFHHAWGGGVTDPERFAVQPWDPSGHVLLDRVRDLAGTDERLTAAGDPRRAATRSWAWCPTTGSTRCPAPRRRRTCGAAYVAFLTARLGTRQWLPEVAG